MAFALPSQAIERVKIMPQFVALNLPDFET